MILSKSGFIRRSRVVALKPFPCPRTLPETPRPQLPAVGGGFSVLFRFHNLDTLKTTYQALCRTSFDLSRPRVCRLFTMFESFGDERHRRQAHPSSGQPGLTGPAGPVACGGNRGDVLGMVPASSLHCGGAICHFPSLSEASLLSLHAREEK